MKFYDIDNVIVQKMNSSISDIIKSKGIDQFKEIESEFVLDLVGTNHILPTSGSAKFSSGLSINEFIKKISIVTLSKLGVEKIGNQAIKLSEYEKLFAHTQSIKSRM